MNEICKRCRGSAKIHVSGRKNGKNYKKTLRCPDCDPQNRNPALKSLA